MWEYKTNIINWNISLIVTTTKTVTVIREEETINAIFWFLSDSLTLSSASNSLAFSLLYTQGLSPE